MSRLIRFVMVLAAMLIAATVAAAGASAHVVVSPASAVGGSETQPDSPGAERGSDRAFHQAGDPPPVRATARFLGNTSPSPAGRQSLTKSKLAKPITTDDGTATEYTSTISWTATEGGIEPDQYQDFDVSVGPLPNRER